MKHYCRADYQFTDEAKFIYSLSSYQVLKTWGHQKGDINLTSLFSSVPTLSTEMGSLSPWWVCPQHLSVGVCEQQAWVESWATLLQTHVSSSWQSGKRRGSLLLNSSYWASYVRGTLSAVNMHHFIDFSEQSCFKSKLIIWIWDLERLSNTLLVSPGPRLLDSRARGLDRSSCLSINLLSGDVGNIFGAG